MPPTNTFSSKDEQPARKKFPQPAQPVPTPLTSETIRRARVGVFDISPTQVLALQRTIGNYAVQRLLASSRPAPTSPSPSTPAIQPKPASNTIQRDTDDEDDTESYWKPSTESEDGDSWMDDDLNDDIDNDMDDDDGDLSDDSEFDWIPNDHRNDRIRSRPMGRMYGTRRPNTNNQPYVDPLDPTARQVKRKVGFGKMLGWSAIILGAHIGDFIRSRFPNQPRHAWRDRARDGYAQTGAKARNKLRAKNAKKDYKRYLKEDLKDEIINDDPDNPIYFKDLKKSDQRRLLREAKKMSRREDKEFKKLYNLRKPKTVGKMVSY